MFSKLTTRIAMKKVGIPSNTFDTKQFESKSNNSRDPNAQNELLPFANPFANLSVPKAWHSWATPVPPPVDIAAAPIIGGKAPSALKLQLPPPDRRPVVVCFLRNTGDACKGLCSNPLCNKAD